MTTYQIESRVLEEQPTAAMFATLSVDELPAFFTKAFSGVAAYLSKYGVGPAGMPYARFHQIGEGQFEVEAGFPATTPVAGEGDVEPSDLPACVAAVTVHTGPYDQMAPAYAALKEWVDAHGDTPIGDAWEVYFSEPTGDPATWRTEIVQPYREA